MYCPESLAAVRLMDVAAVGGGCMVRPSDRATERQGSVGEGMEEEDG